MTTTQTPSPLSITPMDRRRVAVTAQCDPGCVTRYLQGSTSLRSTTIDRIERALHIHKLEGAITARAAVLAAR
jgi:hypothetical protein